MEPSLPKNHEDHIAGKGHNSIDTLQFGTQIYSDASNDEHSRCESSIELGIEKNSRQLQHGSWRTSRAKRTLFWKHKETNRKSTLPF